MNFDDVSVEELAKGYRKTADQKAYQCLFCDESFDVEEIFPINGRLFKAGRAADYHIQMVHGSVFDSLIALDKRHTGLSEVQTELLQLFHQGLQDKEIVEKTSANSVSTIRQHRFKLKEKERQAKVLLAIMENLEPTEQYEPIHKGATMMDERYAVTSGEKEKILETYFKNGLGGAIETFPSKEKRKIVILQQIMKRFETGKQYNEKEVNEILKTAYSDFVTIRRYLIEYGFMDRSNDGATYWVKEV
ncbi:DUF2087 domain-containing protein [Lysinibacillus sp. 3P01SB]|uniref:DUF2087 domain-containing protein n=1 Tax=Lysinibacillus sp. 3P01SB TaxID=3132284 RepID=UPI0039A72EEF